MKEIVSVLVIIYEHQVSIPFLFEVLGSSLELGALFERDDDFGPALRALALGVRLRLDVIDLDVDDIHNLRPLKVLGDSDRDFRRLAQRVQLHLAVFLLLLLCEVQQEELHQKHIDAWLLVACDPDFVASGNELLPDLRVALCSRHLLLSSENKFNLANINILLQNFGHKSLSIKSPKGRRRQYF